MRTSSNFCGMVVFRPESPDETSSNGTRALDRLLSCSTLCTLATRQPDASTTREVRLCAAVSALARWMPAAPSVYHRRVDEVTESDVTAFILAGGKSLRMGQDKAFVELGGP